MNKLFRILAPVVLLAGAVIFLVMGIGNVRARESFLPAVGTITDIRVRYGVSDTDTEYLVPVRYEVDGVTYESPLGEYSASMRVGQSVDILYNPENPNEIMSAGRMGMILTFGMCVLCAFSCVALVRRLLRGDGDKTAAEQ